MDTNTLDTIMDMVTDQIIILMEKNKNGIF